MSTKEWIGIVLESARIIISWPAVVLILGLWLLIRHKEAIDQALRNIRKASVPGASVEFAPTQTATAIPQLTEFIQTELDHIRGELVQVRGEREQAQQALAQVAKLWWFEKLWGYIYGSQIAIMEGLAAAPQREMRWLDIYHNYYLPAVARWPGLASYNFNAYMNFLSNVAGFVTWNLNVDPRNPPVRLTDLGQEFLTYLATWGYTREMRIN